MINSGGTPRPRGVLLLLPAFNQLRLRFSSSAPLSRSPPIGGGNYAGGAPEAPTPRSALAAVWASSPPVAGRRSPPRLSAPPPSPCGSGVALAPLGECIHLPFGGIPTIGECAVWSVGAVWGQCGAVCGGVGATPLRANAPTPPQTAISIIQLDAPAIWQPVVKR